MKFAFWYLLSVAAGLGLLFSVIRETSGGFGQSKGDDIIADGDRIAMPGQNFESAQTHWALIAGVAFGVFAFALWRVFKESSGISKGEWLRIGLATAAMVTAPIIFGMALGWKI
jgi:hypothetical protein